MRAIIGLLVVAAAVVVVAVAVPGWTPPAGAQGRQQVKTLYTAPLGAYIRLGNNSTSYQATAQNAGHKAVKVSIQFCDLQGVCEPGFEAQCQQVMLEPGASCEARRDWYEGGFRYAKIVVRGSGKLDVRASLQMRVVNDDTYDVSVPYAVDAR